MDAEQPASNTENYSLEKFQINYVKGTAVPEHLLVSLNRVLKKLCKEYPTYTWEKDSKVIVEALMSDPELPDRSRLEVYKIEAEKKKGAKKSSVNFYITPILAAVDVYTFIAYEPPMRVDSPYYRAPPLRKAEPLSSEAQLDRSFVFVPRCCEDRHDELSVLPARDFKSQFSVDTASLILQNFEVRSESKFMLWNLKYVHVEPPSTEPSLRGSS